MKNIINFLIIISLFIVIVGGLIATLIFNFKMQFARYNFYKTYIEREE